MQGKFIVATIGILSVAGIVISCVFKGIDGTLIAGGVGIIGTIVGYCFGKKK